MAHAEVEFRAPTDGGELVGLFREGPPGTPPALLLHGGPGLSDYLEPLANELDGLFPIARYQQRGIAPSVTSGDRNVGRHVEDAVAILDALGWERALVIGHSWGGHLAMHFAVAHPERLQGLVAIDPLCAVGDGGLAEFVARLEALVPPQDRPRYDELQQMDPIPATEREESFRMVWPFYFADPANAAPFPNFRFDNSSGKTWESIDEHFEKRTLELAMPNLKVPFLHIHGEKSPLPIAEARRTVELVPGAKLAAVTDSGHWPWLERPGVVRELIEDWAAGIWPT